MLKHIKSIALATIKIIEVSFALTLSSVFVYFMMNTLSEILNNKYLMNNALALTPVIYMTYIIMLANYFGGKNEIKKC